MRLLGGVLGAMLLATVLWDAFETIILPRRVSGRIRLTRLFYRSTWIPWRAAARALSGRKRDVFLSIFGPLSLILLLALWAVGSVFSFGLLQWAAGSAMRVVGDGGGGAPGFWSDMYMSGTTFFTLGLGDVVPRTALAKTLTVIEAGTGFAFLAAVIGYFPVIYQAFSRREVAISLLDARAGSPPSASELLWRHRGDPGAGALTELLRDWERWAADVLESHLSYPPLAYFRSQHYNESWLAALTTILDASAVVMIGLDGWCARQAELTFAAGAAGGASRFGPAGQAPGAAGPRWARAAGPARLRAAAHGAAPDVRAVRRGAGALPHGAAAALGARSRTSRQLADERVGQGRAVAGAGVQSWGRRSLLAVAAEAAARRLPLKRQYNARLRAHAEPRVHSRTSVAGPGFTPQNRIASPTC